MKILLVKTSSLGDLIHTFPVVDYLTQKGAEVDWVVEKGGHPLIAAHPHVRRALKIDTKAWRRAPFSREARGERHLFKNELHQETYDFVFDLQGNLKSAWVTAAAHARRKVGFGLKTVPEWPNVLFTRDRFNPSAGGTIRADYLAVVKQAFADTTPFVERPCLLTLNDLEKTRLALLFTPDCRPTIVAPFSAWENKCLSAKQLIDLLKNRSEGPFWFLQGSSREKERAALLCKEVGGQVLDQLSLPLLQHVMAKAALVISMDSLPLHLSATTKTPSLSFFGPSLAQKYAPEGPQHESFQGSCPYGITFEKRCPRLRTCKTGACLKNAPLPR